MRFIVDFLSNKLSNNHLITAMHILDEKAAIWHTPRKS